MHYIRTAYGVPCDDAALLRRWAYEGFTLRREVPNDR